MEKTKEYTPLKPYERSIVAISPYKDMREEEEETLGRKDDKDKSRWDLVPWVELEEIVEVLTNGSKKYSDDNWKRVSSPRRRYFAALCRHVIAWWKGEEKDPEDGKSHLAHAGCCLLFLMWFDNSKGE